MASTTVDSASSGTRGRKRRNLSKNEGKKFVCTNDGCGRSFTRAEHLQRHLLNHSTGEYTCDRCRAHFKRRDLLGKNDAVFPWLRECMAVFAHERLFAETHGTTCHQDAALLSCYKMEELPIIYRI